MDEKFPETLYDAVKYFADRDRCIKIFAGLRWTDGIPVCPHCQTKDDHTYITTRRIWKCKECKKQFSVKKGSIFEDSPIGLEKWFVAIWMLANAKNGISSCELHRALGVTQKTAWFMLHRIRLALEAGTFEKVKGVIEADETYIGGRTSNMHKDKKEEMPKGRGTVGKAIVMGIMERGTEGKLSSVRAKVIENIGRETLHGEIRSNVESGSSIFTDSLASYRGGLEADYVHQYVDHAVQYVEGIVHTNGLENFWSLLKRTVRGTYTHINVEHLFRYLDEQCYRFNYRKDDDQGRFVQALGASSEKRLTYKNLTRKKGVAKASGEEPQKE